MGDGIHSFVSARHRVEDIDKKTKKTTEKRRVATPKRRTSRKSDPNGYGKVQVTMDRFMANYSNLGRFKITKEELSEVKSNKKEN